jgi:hypothetical protein
MSLLRGKKLRFNNTRCEAVKSIPLAVIRMNRA